MAAAVGVSRVEPVTRELEFPTLYQTAPHACPYLTDKTAVNLILDPQYPVNTSLYERLLGHGFRRNGNHYYRPFCNECSACISVRLPVEEFVPSRSQRRTLKKNDDLDANILRPLFDEQHFQLYLRYQSMRHTGDSMDDPDPQKYRRFLIDSEADTFFVEIRKQEKVIGLAIADQVGGGMSAIYTFFDPDESKRSLGTFAILKQIEIAHARGLDWIYLGYWIAGSKKMVYKNRFHPLQYFDTKAGRWKPIPPADSV